MWPGGGGRQGVEVIRAGVGASPGQWAVPPCTTRTPQGRALCVFCPRWLQEMRGTHLSSFLDGPGTGSPTWRRAGPLALYARLLPCPFSLPESLLEGWVGGALKPRLGGVSCQSPASADLQEAWEQAPTWLGLSQGSRGCGSFLQASEGCEAGYPNPRDSSVRVGGGLPGTTSCLGAQVAAPVVRS